MQEEYESLTRNKSWILVDLPPGAKLISAKWVYKIKTGHDNQIKRYKSRLVGRGYTQIATLHYNETFAPTISYATSRMILSFAAMLGWHIHHCDVDTAYLYALKKSTCTNPKALLIPSIHTKYFAF